jgi:hypothetical protein
MRAEDFEGFIKGKSRVGCPGRCNAGRGLCARIIRFHVASMSRRAAASNCEVLKHNRNFTQHERDMEATPPWAALLLSF